MNKILPRIPSFVFLLAVLFLFCITPIKSAYSQYACLPTCIETDGKFLALASGTFLQTINSQNLEVQLTSPGDRNTFEIGIFDGNGTGQWDDETPPPPLILEYSLFLDPDGDGSGNSIMIAQWSSDGSFGDNTGNPMPDNDWFVSILQNSPQALTPGGFYSYRLEARIVNPNPAGSSINSFKVRSDDRISIIAGSAFNYLAPINDFFDFITIYPNIDFFDPACVGGGLPGGWCNPVTDPSCCLNPTTYDGDWKFCFITPEGIDTLDVWDGDFDFGSASFNSNDICIDPDGVSVDTDDINTPVPLPPWAIGTDAVPQGVSSPTAPPDDQGCFTLHNRPPSVNYSLMGTNGEIYTNVNPSGNIEWELFNISTLPFNPLLYDIHVDSIEPGLWCINTSGNDMQNLNSFRLPYDLIGVDEEGDPVLPEEMTERIPTLNEWGLITLSAFVLLISVYYLRRQRKVATEIK